MFLYKVNEDISLRLIENRDAERVFELTDKSRDYLSKWLPWVNSTTKLGDEVEFIKICINDYVEKKNLNAVILFKREIVGIAGYHTINWSNKTAYVGYWLGEEFQGNGIMTKVTKALTDYAFNELNLNKVEIRVAVGNKKSWSIPERLNFVKEGFIRQAVWLNDHYEDHVVYGILADEWDEKYS